MQYRNQEESMDNGKLSEKEKTLQKDGSNSLIETARQVFMAGKENIKVVVKVPICEPRVGAMEIDGHREIADFF